jgi:hypothetical protein
LSGIPQAQAQTFSSGSTGADGALNLTTAGTILFNPPAMTPPLHPTISNVFNFTTVTIASGVTLTVSGGIFQAPVYWLATGAVEIDGTVDLSGAVGNSGGTSLQQRVPALPGAGGYPGGVGGWTGNNQAVAEPGSGPGGGGVTSGAGNGVSATYTGGQDPVPILGGSGGGGGSCAGSGTFGGGGGAGGGALIIASSVSITVKGSILAPGGGGGYTVCQSGGGGGGGVIRLVAPVVTTSGSLSVAGGGICCGLGPGASGLVRLEYFQGSIGGSITGTSVTGIPFPVLAPTTAPSAIEVASIAGTAINANPFMFPNTTLNTASPVAVVIQAQYVPKGTVPMLYIFSESGSDQVIAVPALVGTLQSSTATVNVAFPPGASYGYVKAVWNNGPIANIRTKQ